MKVRTGFVSNSSSSSFTCCVSGCSESGYNVDPSNFNMCTCENGHTMYQKYFVGDINEEVDKMLEEWYIEEEADGKLTDERKEQLKKEAPHSFFEYFPAKCCPVCRLDIVTSGMELLYLRSKCGMTQGEIQREMKEKFGDIDGWKKRSPVK